MDVLQPIFFHISYHTTQALTAFIQPSSYLYWPYTLSTLALAFWLGRAKFFNKALWWNPSSIQDYKLYFANFLVWPALMAVLWVSEGSVVATLNRWLGGNAAPSAWAQSWVARIAFTVAIFVAYDLGRFVAHTLLHRIPSLWEIHKVHHSAVVMTPMTAYRLHPLEIAIMSAPSVLLTGATAWAFNHFLGAGIMVYQFLGMHIFLTLLNFIDNLRHSPVWISYGSFLNHWIISPAHHQLHHSREERHYGCNVGFSLAIWDRMAGSLIVPTDKPEVFELGLDEASDPKYTGIFSLYVRPVVASVRSLFGFARPPHAP
jgi:sterol desaturase/sphingolipid hydroxylase (fatty acid hydroxylase superfamily)